MAVLPHRFLDIDYALELVEYYTHRNFVAYKSHRKKAMKEIKMLIL